MTGRHPRRGYSHRWVGRVTCHQVDPAAQDDDASMLSGRILGTCLFFQVLLTWHGPPIAWGGQALSIGGQPQVQLEFRIIIPQILYLQIGSDEPPLDAVAFKTANIPGPWKVVAEPQQIPVRAAGSLPRKQPIAMTVNSARPMSDSAKTIPLQAVSGPRTRDRQPGSFSSGANQKVEYWKGSGNRTFSFSYISREGHPVGNDVGRVTYTLSAP